MENILKEKNKELQNKISKLEEEKNELEKFKTDLEEKIENLNTGIANALNELNNQKKKIDLGKTEELDEKIQSLEVVKEFFTEKIKIVKTYKETEEKSTHISLLDKEIEEYEGLENKIEVAKQFIEAFKQNNN